MDRFGKILIGMAWGGLAFAAVSFGISKSSLSQETKDILYLVMLFGVGLLFAALTTLDQLRQAREDAAEDAARQRNECPVCHRPYS